MDATQQEQKGIRPTSTKLEHIGLADALKEIGAYRALLAGLDYPENVDKTVACWIERSDLLGMLEEGSVDGIRCYFGLRELDGKMVTCLVMAGTRLDRETGINKDLITDADGACLLYELTTPCPNTCDISSPLLTLV